MPGEQCSETHVVVDVFVVVDIDHAATCGMRHDNRMRVVRLETRGHTCWHDLTGSVGGTLRAHRTI